MKQMASLVGRSATVGVSMVCRKLRPKSLSPRRADDARAANQSEPILPGNPGSSARTLHCESQQSADIFGHVDGVPANDDKDCPNERQNDYSGCYEKTPIRAQQISSVAARPHSAASDSSAAADRGSKSRVKNDLRSRPLERFQWSPRRACGDPKPIFELA